MEKYRASFVQNDSRVWPNTNFGICHFTLKAAINSASVAPVCPLHLGEQDTHSLDEPAQRHPGASRFTGRKLTAAGGGEYLVKLRTQASSLSYFRAAEKTVRI